MCGEKLTEPTLSHLTEKEKKYIKIEGDLRICTKNRTERGKSWIQTMMKEIKHKLSA